MIRGRPGSRWWLGVLALAPLIAVLVVGLPGEQGCGGEVGALPARADRALPCDTPLPAAAPAAAPGTRIFLLRDGATFTAGADDGTRNQSQVLQTRGLATLEVPPAGYDPATWRSIEACLKQRFAAYDVELSTERPAQGPYVTAVFGGTGAPLGFGPEVKGTAPLDAVGCKTSPNAVAFVFSAQLGADAREHCDIAAQEIAHAFSADHVLLAEDAMSYLSSSVEKTFRDAAAKCGEFEERACACGRPSQNSHQLLLERLGAAKAGSDGAPPQVSASWTRTRGDSASITVSAADDRSVKSVQLTVETPTGVIRSTCGDGTLSCAPTASGWVFTVPGVMEEARFSASAQDGVGNLTATPAEALSTAAAAGPRLTPSVAVRKGEQGEVLWVSVAVSGGTPSSATLEWTDATGTQRLAMCAVEPGAFRLPLLAEVDRSARQFVIEVQGAGRTPAQQLALP